MFTDTVRATNVGLAMFNAATRNGNNHPLSRLIKAKIEKNPQLYSIKEGKPSKT